ncbi:MAG: DUF2268 domain-containing putative Zn-dependent protease [Pseudomonadota bacterium]
MTLRLHIFDRGDTFSAQHDEIRNAIGEAIDFVEDRVKLDNVDVIAFSKEFGADPELWTMAASPNTVLLGIDAAGASSDTLHSALKQTTIFHLHQCFRLRRVRTWSVGDALIFEGLAPLAATEAVGEPFRSRISKEAIRDAANRIHDASDAHRKWLYAREKTAHGPAHTRAALIGAALSRDAMERLGLDAWAAARLPTKYILDSVLPSPTEEPKP